MNIDDSQADEAQNLIQKLDIHFKESCSTFYAGSVICGTVEVNTLDDIPIRGIRAQFRGESYVYWQNRNEDVEGSGIGSLEVVKDHATIWNQLFTIWGNKGE